MLRTIIEDAVKQMLIGDGPETSADFGTTHKIVIAQRGFVFAGDVRRDGEYIVIDNAVNIRKWGTTKGLGELASRGTLQDTKADHAGTVRLHQLAVVGMLDCQEKINATT